MALNVSMVRRDGIPSDQWGFPVRTLTNWFFDIDNVRANVAGGANLTLDKALWNTVLFTQLGGGTPAAIGMAYECTVLDDNTLTLNNSSAFAIEVGICAMRVS